MLPKYLFFSIALYVPPIVVIEKESGEREGEFFASYANLKSAIKYPNAKKNTLGRFSLDFIKMQRVTARFN